MTHIENNKTNYYPVLAGSVCLVSVIFPRIGLIISCFLLIIPINLNKGMLRCLKCIFSFGVGALAYSYIRLNETGDVYNYHQWFIYAQSDFSLTKSFDFTLYDSIYYSWTYMQALIIYLGGDFKWVNFVCLFLFGFVSLSLINLISKELNSHSVRRLLLIKLLLYFSYVFIFTNYKSTLAIAIVSYAILLFYTNRSLLKAVIWAIIGVGFHPAAILILLLPMLANRFSISLKIIITIFICGLIIKPIFISILPYIPDVPILTAKINYYMAGDWSEYRFHERAEFLLFVQLITSVIFYLYTYKLAEKISHVDLKLFKYLKLVALYLIIIGILISFRTLSERYVLGGIFLNFLVIGYIIKYKYLLNRKMYGWWFLLFIISFDLKILMLPFYTSSIIGSGFPSNLFESILIFIE